MEGIGWISIFLTIKLCKMRYNKSAQQVLIFFKTGSEAPSYKGFLYEKVLIMILFNDKMYSKVIIIIKKVGA